jgi:HEPN domain-containing protein
VRPDPGREGRRWVAQAENDLAFAALAARERFFAQACFNAQQAAEKALKAVLYARGAEQVLGHSVADLIAECAQLDGAFATLHGRVAPLDQFYVATRDPNTLPGGIPAEAFGQADAARAVGMASEVLEAVRRALG